MVRTISSLARHYRPMLFFGLVSLAFFVLGALCGLPVIGEWIAFQYIYRVPLAILATGLMVLAAGSLGIGLILDSAVHQNRLNYERDFLVHRRGTQHRARTVTPASGAASTDEHLELRGDDSRAPRH